MVIAIIVATVVISIVPVVVPALILSAVRTALVDRAMIIRAGRLSRSVKAREENEYRP
jgi:hypothetical protein